MSGAEIGSMAGPIGAAAGAIIGAAIGYAAGQWLSDLLLNESDQNAEESCPEGYAPDGELPRDEHGNPLPDSDNAHTQIGKKKSKRTGEEYRQSREWGDKNDRGNHTGREIPKKDTDWTNHNRPKNHTNPHDHPYNPNTGKRL